MEDSDERLTCRPKLRLVKNVGPINLLTEIRKNTFEVSHAELAKRMDISKHALIRLEQGTYDKILPKALDWYLDNTSYSELRLVECYEDFQHETRALHMYYFGDHLEMDLYVQANFEGSPYPDHPLRILRGRRSLNLAQVAKDLCLPYSTLVYFERNYKQQKTVPKNLVNVLREIGYSVQDVSLFCWFYGEFRKGMGCLS